jgi:hypothetical protein
MWGNVFDLTQESVRRARNAVRTTGNAPNTHDNGTAVRPRPSTPDDQTHNPRPRNRARAELTAETPRCCDCTRHAKCSADIRSGCPCVAARRECHNCLCQNRCENRPSEDAVSAQPGVGWANLPTAPPPPPPPPEPTRRTINSRRRRSSLRLSQNPLPIGTYNENNPPRNASTDEDGEPAADEPAADPPNDGDGESITNAAADAIPAADGILQNPEGERDVEIPPPLEPFETEVEDADETDSDDEAEAELTPTRVGALDPEKMADLARQEPSLADDKLIAVYGDTVHRNDGRDLHGGGWRGTQ